MKKKALCLLLALVMMFSLVACGGDKGGEETPDAPGTSESVPTAPPEDAKIKETIRIGYNEDLASADPFANTVSSTAMFTNLTFDSLIHLDPNTQEITPELATEWKDVSAAGDATAWELKLAEGVTFHNGNKFTADDVKFTFEYATDANNVVSVIGGVGVLAIESIEVVNDYTIRFNLSQPVLDFANYLTHKMYDKESFDTLPKEEAGIIGTGPYYYNSELTTSGIQFGATRYEDYWGGTEDYPTKNIVFVYYPAEDTQAAALQAGEIDYMSWIGSVASVPSLQADSNLTVYETTGGYSYYLGMNYRKDLFHDPEIRKAISMSIDREALVAVAYDGYGGSASQNFCSPIGLGHNPDVKAPGYDVEAAKAIFAEKGWTGKTIVLYYPGLAVNKAMCEVIQNGLSAAGLNIEVMSRDATNWSALKTGDEYDMFVDCCAYRGALLYCFDRFFGPTGALNNYDYRSAEFDAAVAKVSSQPTYEDMVKEFTNLQQFVAEDLPVVPLAYNKAFCAARNNVYGVQESLAPSSNYCDYAQVYVTE